ncbi:MAG: EamA family transporter [Patescibacteria group bacterium]
MFLPFFWALLSSLLDVLDTVTYKTAADISAKMRADFNLLYFLGYCIVLIVTPAFFLFFHGDIVRDMLAVSNSWKDAAIFLAITVSTIGLGNLLTKAYSFEKISVLAPYTQVSQISSILFGFLLFRSQTTYQQLAAAFVASMIILFSNMEKGKLRFNKYCLILGAGEMLRSIATLLSAYVASTYHPFSIVSFQNFLGFLILGAYFLFRPKGFVFPKEKPERKKFVWSTVIPSLCWVFVTAISLYLYQEIGVVATILLSMITLAVTLVASYLIYHDVPRKKDVVTTSLVLLCIGVGFV